jgi:hypothetical protein
VTCWHVGWDIVTCYHEQHLAKNTLCLAPYPFLLLQLPALMGSGMAMRAEWIVVVLAVLPAQSAATALLVAIAPVSAAMPQIKLVWQVRQAGMLYCLGLWYISHVCRPGFSNIQACVLPRFTVYAASFPPGQSQQAYHVYCLGLRYVYAASFPPGQSQQAHVCS